ncbi:SH3 beta-barrel fold-containing protein [Seonamhaeicola sp. MEBiC1930]|uniref:SH3 beta-barrel fold-containing protein n=1 Tax=Seonamhaeicola sp. MEBiC01930 TaxID=2976768 RepID=UPI0032503D5D
MKTTFRSKVFKRAYEIMNSTGKAFSVCLSKAWVLYRLAKEMRNNDEVHFTYEKKDGSLRRALGTLRDVKQFVKGTGKTNNKVFHYWDLQASAFRSFKVENLISVF